MKQWAILFDVDRCNGCCNCVLATLDEYTGNTHSGYAAAMSDGGAAWLTMQVVERGVDQTVDIAYVPSTCRHCADAPCQRAAPDAVSRRADGIVMIDPVKAKGRRELVEACPFGAIHWNEAQDLPQNWNLDAHLLDNGWVEPRASQACPTAALQVVKMGGSEVRQLAGRGFAQMPMDRQYQSRLFVRGLKRVTSELIGGSVAQEVNGRQEPLASAPVFLEIDGSRFAQTVTDELGAFRFDELDPLPASLDVVVEHDGAAHRWTRSRNAIDNHLHVGVLQLDASTSKGTA